MKDISLLEQPVLKRDFRLPPKPQAVCAPATSRGSERLFNIPGAPTIKNNIKHLTSADMATPNNSVPHCPPGTTEYFIEKHRCLKKAYHDWQCLLLDASRTLNDNFPPGDEDSLAPLHFLKEHLNANFRYARNIERKMRILLPVDAKSIDPKDQNLKVLLFLKWYREWMGMLGDAAEELERVAPMELEGSVGDMKREVERARFLVGSVEKELKEMLPEGGGGGEA